MMSPVLESYFLCRRLSVLAAVRSTLIERWMELLWTEGQAGLPAEPTLTQRPWDLHSPLPPHVAPPLTVLRAPLPVVQNTAHGKPKPVLQKPPVMGNGGSRAEQDVCLREKRG